MYRPPVSGKAPAISASVSAPQRANSPPIAHTASMGPGPGNRVAIPAGERKIPDPIVEPTSTATALHRPSRRTSAGRRDAAAADAPGVTRSCGGDEACVLIVLWYLRASHWATSGWLPRRSGQVHLSPDAVFGCRLVVLDRRLRVRRRPDRDPAGCRQPARHERPAIRDGAGRGGVTAIGPGRPVAGLGFRTDGRAPHFGAISCRG